MVFIVVVDSEPLWPVVDSTMEIGECCLVMVSYVVCRRKGQGIKRAKTSIKIRGDGIKLGFIYIYST